MDCKKAIFNTLKYSDLFDFPLTREELWHFLKSDKATSPSVFEKVLKKLPQEIALRDNYYHLQGRSSIVAVRKQREKISKRKLQLAQKTAKVLALMPSVLFIGVSGSLALKNADKNADIDLFVITKQKKLWITRLFLLGLLQLLGVRRKKHEKSSRDMICLNMLLDESKLALSADRRTVYTAHEIAQIMPLFERNGTYKKFLRSNRWVSGFMPNALQTRAKPFLHLSLFGRVFSLLSAALIHAPSSELLAKKIQMWKMYRHRTNETITDTLLAFHPLDYQQKVLQHLQHMK